MRKLHQTNSIAIYKEKGEHKRKKERKEKGGRKGKKLSVTFIKAILNYCIMLVSLF
jgi:hypothetical protein